METWNNFQEGFTANECLLDTFVDAVVWHIFDRVTQLHRQALQIKSNLLSQELRRLLSRRWVVC